MKPERHEKAWAEIVIPVAAETEEGVSNFLFELGTEGVSVHNNQIRAYFKGHQWDSSREKMLRHYLASLVDLGFVVSGEFQVNSLADQDWNSEWKKTYLPIEINSQIVIVPSWQQYIARPDQVAIQIDPQMAFGTGTHETTQLVLQIMADNVATARWVLDIGTGTGILAIVAVKLFQATVAAFDDDLVAVFTAKQNCVQNQVADNIQLLCLDRPAFRQNQFDLILANINRSTLEKLLPEIFPLLTVDGRVIFSGILAEEKARFLSKLTAHRFSVLQQRTMGEWIAIMAQPMR
ncbi:MAG: 50S ribosomal protein L11 methyltransferase [bacterium]|nr:50S ribosomal protein L11 methyltransferase [bacterium]